MRGRPRACVIMRCSSEAIKNLMEAMSIVCTACLCTGAVFFACVSKIQEGMPAVSAMATPLRVYNLCFEFTVLLFLCWL